MEPLVKDGEKRIIVFDIDGTLSNHNKRHHLYEQKDWDKINEESTKDPPHDEILYLNQLIADDPDNIIVICTARREDCKGITEAWLQGVGVIYHDIMFRKIGDYRNDYEIKEEMLYDMQQKYNMKPFMVFEDRQSVVNMWRKHGVKCMQVEDNNIDYD